MRQFLRPSRRGDPLPVPTIQLHETNEERSGIWDIHDILHLRIIGLERANGFEDALNLPPRLLAVAVVNPLESREHPVENEGQSERSIGRAGVSLSSNADLLQLALAGTGSDSLGEPLVQSVHVFVDRTEASL